MRRIVLAIMLLFTTTFANKALDDLILYNPNAAKPAPVNLDEDLTRHIGCYSIRYLKEAVAQGANLSYINDKGYSAFTNFAQQSSAQGMSEYCKEVAHYLSSIGAIDSGGYTSSCYFATQKYDPPLVYENKHLKVTFNKYSFSGASSGTLKNKTDEPIYLYIETSIINGVKDSRSLKNDQYPDGWALKANSEDDKFSMNFMPSTSKKGSENNYSKFDFSKYPKVVNNKLKLVKEYIITYSYKGKTYEFKLPVITQELDMTYEKC
jgi:hypothetical protein